MTAGTSGIDAYLRENERWRNETIRLRLLILECGLAEEMKWAKPCYTFQESNVVIIQGFKEHCALLFCKGALLKDPQGILKKPGENTQGARRVLFTNVREIDGLAPVLQAYIKEAVAAQIAGSEISFKKNPEPIPAELKEGFKENPVFKSAFFALTPGRRRGYILYFNGAKQSLTRTNRIEKCKPHILSGRGLND